VAINRLQSDKLLQTDNASASPSATQCTQAGTSAAVSHIAKLSQKLLFPTYDDQDDPLLWINRCDQFFRIQDTPASGKVFLATFYMTGDAAQWYTVTP
jgi:hypothetical protein